MIGLVICTLLICATVIICILGWKYLDERDDLSYQRCFGTRIGTRVYDVTGDVTENHKWISWLEYSNKASKEKITKENIMF